jgi:hypothetical protein
MIGASGHTGAPQKGKILESDANWVWDVSWAVHVLRYLSVLRFVHADDCALHHGDARGDARCYQKTRHRCHSARSCATNFH